MNSLRDWCIKLEPYWLRILKIQIDPHLESNRAARDVFEPTDEQLAELTNRHYLELRMASIHSLEPLRVFGRLQVLQISSLAELRSLDTLACAPQIEELYVHHMAVPDWSVLKMLKKLRVLNLRQTGLTSVNVLQDLVQLEELQLDESSLEILSGLEKLSNLHTLALRQCQARDLSAIQSLQHLRVLVLANLNITSLPALPFPLLEELYLDNLPVQELGPISGLNEIRKLSVYGLPISDLRAVRSFDRLEMLNLLGTQVRDLSALDSCRNLKELHLNETRFAASEMHRFIRLHPHCKIQTEKGSFPFRTYHQYRVIKSFTSRQYEFEKDTVLSFVRSDYNHYDGIEICYFHDAVRNQTLRWDIYQVQIEQWTEFLTIVSPQEPNVVQGN